MLFTWPMVWRALQSTLRSCGFPWELSAPSCTQLSTPRYRCPGIDTGTKYFPEREGSLGKCQRDRWLFWVTPEPGQHYEKQPHLFQTQTVPSAWRLSRFVALRWAAVAAAYRGSRSVSGVQEPGKVLEMSCFFFCECFQFTVLPFPLPCEERKSQNSSTVAGDAFSKIFFNSNNSVTGNFHLESPVAPVYIGKAFLLPEMICQR